MDQYEKLIKKVEKLAQWSFSKEKNFIKKLYSQEGKRHLKLNNIYHKNDIIQIISAAFNSNFWCNDCKHYKTATCFTCKKIQNILKAM